MTDSTKTIYHPRPKAESTLFSPLHCRGDSQHTRYKKMQNEPNYNNANRKLEIENRKSLHSSTHPHIHFFMQNEPNLMTYAEPKAKSRRAGKPNFILNAPNLAGYMLKKLRKIPKYSKKTQKMHALFHLFYPPKAAFLHFFAGFSIPFASFINCFMQNEPNFTPNAPTKHTNDANFIPIFHYLSTIIYPPKAAFPQKCPKKHALFHLFYPPKAAFCRFLQLLDTNTLNSMYNKDLHEFLPEDMKRGHPQV